MKEKKANKPNPYTDQRLTKFGRSCGPIKWKKNAPSHPQIQVTGSGISINGIKFKIDLSKLPHEFALLLGLSALPEAAGESSFHYYAHLRKTVYRLWLSGIENLDSARKALDAGECDFAITDKRPEDYSNVASYYDHGVGTTPYYAAVLSIEEGGIRNQTAIDCVSNKIEQAHDNWQDEATSMKSILILIGIILAMTLLSGLMVYFCNRQKNREEDKVFIEEQDSPAATI